VLASCVGESTGPHTWPWAGESSRARQLTLAATAAAAGAARQATQEALASWRLAHLTDTAILLVSELVTNVVRHAQTGGMALVLRLETAGPWVRIEVHDADPCQPQPRIPDRLDGSGFGFVLVDALADKWGVREAAIGKVVWVELDTRRDGEPES
jgi:anti-sigma regulatory factor (Ser/Thr protein kinase)